MSHGVLPARGCVLEVGEVREYPVVDVLHGQPLDGRVLDGHEYQTAERVRGLVVHVLLRVVRHVGRVGLRVRGGAVQLQVVVLLVTLLAGEVVIGPGGHVLEQVGVLQPGQAGQLVVLLDVQLVHAQLGEAAAAQRLQPHVVRVRVRRALHGLGQGAAGEALAQARHQAEAHRRVGLVVGQRPVRSHRCCCGCGCTQLSFKPWERKTKILLFFIYCFSFFNLFYFCYFFF